MGLQGDAVRLGTRFPIHDRGALPGVFPIAQTASAGQVIFTLGLKGNDMLKILLPIDGSEHSHAAVDAIARQHYPAGSEVRVISVVEPPYIPDTFAGGGGNAGLHIQIVETGREVARAAVDKAADQLRTDEGSRHLKVTTDVLSGSPKRVILADAEAFGADWIVVGSHGLGTVERFLLGSVSQAVALHAKCSVAIVRRPQTPPTTTRLP